MVTGGGGHIGEVVVQALCELGASVAVVDLPGALENVGSEAVSGLGRCVAVPCDLGNAKETRACVGEVLSRLGGLDIIVHSAAFVGTTRFPGWAVGLAEQSPEAWDAAMAVNLRSAFLLVQEARSALASGGRGSVVLLSSIYGMVGPDMRLYEGTGMANPLAYGASKAGLEQLARSLATQLAPHVRVNTVSPGGVERGQPESFQKRYCDRVPLGRMATEEDIKGAIAYLASDLSSYVTGHNLVVDGGWTAW